MQIRFEYRKYEAEELEPFSYFLEQEGLQLKVDQTNQKSNVKKTSTD